MSAFTAGLLLGVLAAGVVCAVALMLWRNRIRDHRRRLFRILKRVRASRRSRSARLQARIDAAERLAEIGTLTGGLAHEIKNPLSTVQLNLQLLQEDLDPNDPAHSRLVNRLATVGREANRLRDILDDFLRFAGKLELRRQKVDLNALLEELVDFFEPQAQLNRVRLRFKPGGGAVVANVDPRLIKQAILNLLLNGLQATPAGGELILSATEADGWAIIEVIDTGEGIAPENVRKIFQAYYSTKRTGTGLGLAMAQRIVHEHGGTLSVNSEVGKGSDFIIRLPI
jgi:signal transduction histidine kinase